MRPSSISCGATMNFTSGLSFISRISSSFVRVPGRTRHEEAFVPLEPVDDVDMFGCGGDFGHAVETRVARYDHVVEAQPGQQLFRLLVLHEHHVEGLQRLPPHAAVGAEEDRVAAEDGRYDVAADRAAAQLGEQVDPEFVFDEDGDFGVGDVQKTRALRGVSIGR